MKNRDAEVSIDLRKDFRGSNFTGQAGRPDGAGQLESGWSTPGLEGADYVVKSYATPIAWHAAGRWYVTTQRFSATTSRHQSIVRRALEFRDVVDV